MDRKKLIENAYDVFGVFKKPLRCTIHDDDCPDCKDHEKTLKAATRETLSTEEVDTIAWSPLPNMNAYAMAYFLPRLIELAVEKAIDRDGDPYMMRFINMVLGGPDGKRFRLLGKEHKYSIFQTLLFLREHYLKIVEEDCWDRELDMAIKRWKSH